MEAHLLSKILLEIPDGLLHMGIWQAIVVVEV